MVTQIDMHLTNKLSNCLMDSLRLYYLIIFEVILDSLKLCVDGQ